MFTTTKNARGSGSCYLQNAQYSIPERILLFIT
jgi:hypothetical protein